MCKCTPLTKSRITTIVIFNEIFLLHFQSEVSLYLKFFDPFNNRRFRINFNVRDAMYFE